MTPDAYALIFCMQRVGDVEIRIDILHVVALVEQLDQLDDLFAGLVIKRNRVLRLPEHRRFARLAEFGLKRFCNVVRRAPASQ